MLDNIMVESKVIFFGQFFSGTLTACILNMGMTVKQHILYLRWSKVRICLSREGMGFDSLTGRVPFSLSSWWFTKVRFTPQHWRIS